MIEEILQQIKSEIHRYVNMQLTLRDRFAMVARNEDLESDECWPVEKCADYIGVAPEDFDAIHDWQKVRAKARYAFADAMLRAREVTP